MSLQSALLDLWRGLSYRAIQFKKELDASVVKEKEDADAAKARLGPK